MTAAPSMNGDRLRKIQDSLLQEGVDAWFFANFHGSDSVATRVLGIPDGVMVTRRWFYLIPAKGDPIKLSHGIEPHVLDTLPGRQLFYTRWQDWQASLKDIFTSCKRVACQYSPMGIIPSQGKLDAGTGEFLRSLNLELVSSGDLVSRFEVTMSPEQEASHYAAMEVLMATMEMAFARVRLGLQAGETMNEYMLAQEMACFMENAGLSYDPSIVGVDAHAADPHYEPGPVGSSVIKPDQVLLLDLTGKKTAPGSICADITWCAWTGREIPAEQQRIFELVRKARDAAIAKAKEVAWRKIQGWEVDRAARDVIGAGGFGEYFIHRTGHSMFEEGHASGVNMDDYETRDTRQILPHTLFTIEPGIYLPGRFGFRNEIDVHVKEGEAVVTGRTQDALPALLA